MSILSDIELVRGVLIGDDESCIRMMMEKYADFNGVPYNAQVRFFLLFSQFVVLGKDM